jgi:serine/threonine protein kinase
VPAHKPSETHSEDLFGQLAGEYRIGRKLGAGGFGTVYEAEHPLLKRKAAVNVLHANPGMNSAAVQRFIEEARSASQIRHRHIVDIFSFGTLPNGRYFYVMDLLEGAPLDRYLREHTQLTPELVLPLLRPIASAIEALHAASLVHRDLKPGNIFLAWESSGEVVPKLLDFGLVKLLGGASLQTTTGVPMGTPYYMAPEQCQGAKLDGRADIYSLGVVCFELLSGKPPFTGGSATAVLVAHVLQEPPRLSALRPELPDALDEPLLRIAPHARVLLDGGEGMTSPLIARVEPGMHHVRVSAPGFFDEERSVEALAGELIPIEVAISGFAVSLAACVTGLFLYALDEPELDEAVPDLRVALPLPGSAQTVAVTGRLRF